MKKYHKTYTTIYEKEMRMSIFRDNLNFINDFNEKESKTYKLGINSYSDLSWTEFHTRFIRNRKPEMRRKKNYIVHSNVNIPDSWDWR